MFSLIGPKRISFTNIFQKFLKAPPSSISVDASVLLRPSRRRPGYMESSRKLISTSPNYCSFRIPSNEHLDLRSCLVTNLGFRVLFLHKSRLYPTNTFINVIKNFGPGFVKVSDV